MKIPRADDIIHVTNLLCDLGSQEPKRPFKRPFELLKYESLSTFNFMHPTFDC